MNETSGLRLTIDLGALVGNWCRLDSLSGAAECAAVIKANAYGLGTNRVVPALVAAGCRTFFVALPDEGIAARKAAPDAAIYVLDGYFPDARSLYSDYDLRPVLGDLSEISAWTRDNGGASALHVDTGMERLGLTMEDGLVLAGNDQVLKAAGVDLVMSHLACADTPDHPLNAEQLERFEILAKAFAGLRLSLANSAGTQLGPHAHYDLVRPGIALYGGASHPDAQSDPVVTAEARILRIRRVSHGRTIGYGAAERVEGERRIAVLAAGYADGYLRAAGANPHHPSACVMISGRPARIVGRVSMDLLTVDITDHPDGAVETGDWAELFGRNVDNNNVAICAGTIAYELLTSLSRRAVRRYVVGDSGAG